MRLLKREHFITEPSYCYEAVVMVGALAIIAMISSIIGLPQEITTIIIGMELVIFSVQMTRILITEGDE